ncbi:hypothetical protein CXB51_015324 [Gossypium anomalum]|uniref:RRM domain-containing protein n=1 Tax=Gossypium anomalum TaxID=47600 RepID=A0A8J5Z6Q6_9ROSI|nr:hypothetical protein CXB51_015324 [Gossypium anomalum]
MQQNGGSDSQTEQNQRPQQQQPPPQPHPQWVAMQYPPTAAAAMVMQHQIMQPQHFVAPPPPPPQHYVPYHHQYHHHGHAPSQQQQQGSGGGGENKTVWVGDLHHWMDENYLHSCFASTGEGICSKKMGLCIYVSVIGLGGYASNGASTQSDGDSSNTTIFVGGLDPNVTEEDLRQPFSQYGELVSVKIPVGKGCGFVRFANRNNAEEALQKLNETNIGKQTFRADYSNQWGGAYYGGQVYDGYGYALPPPNGLGMYAAAATAYGAYPIYGSHQQQVS